MKYGVIGLVLVLMGWALYSKARQSFELAPLLYPAAILMVVGGLLVVVSAFT